MAAQKVGCIVFKQVFEFFVDEWKSLLTIASLVAIIGMLIFKYQSLEGDRFDCEKACEPYASKRISGECACMDMEKRWVFQKAERTPE